MKKCFKCKIIKKANNIKICWDCNNGSYKHDYCIIENCFSLVKKGQSICKHHYGQFRPTLDFFQEWCEKLKL